MRIWHISDTHTYHGHLNIPSDIDMVIFSGDCSNPRNQYANEPEVRSFITWFSSLQIKHKIFVAGNHDSSIEYGLVDRDLFKANGIVYLENESVTIDGINIWGSPFSPTFGDWSFMKNRSKLSRLWAEIPDNTNIVIVHGPPKGILDLSTDRFGALEYCGCSALAKRLLTVRPKLVLFGHIHNCEGIINAGTKTIAGIDTLYSNGSCVKDGRFGKNTGQGNILTYAK
jgi:Icc-related predicted phosphoesterase